MLLDNRRLLPLLARGGRWVGRRSVGSALLRTLGIVSAFTLGHTTWATQLWDAAS